jgi:hypothetical protein
MKKIIIFFIWITICLTKEGVCQSVITKTLTFGTTSTSFMMGSTTYPYTSASCQGNGCAITANSYTLNFDYFSTGGLLTIGHGTTQITTLPGVSGFTMAPYIVTFNTTNIVNFIYLNGNFGSWAVKNVVISYYDNTTTVSNLNSDLVLDFYSYQNQIFIKNHDGNNNFVIELTDMLGKSVCKSSIENNFKLNIPPGIYFACITGSNGKSKIKKVLVE